MDDSELLRAYVQDRSEAAFTRLVERHMPLVYSAAVRLVHGDAHLAKDVVQNVFTALARKAAGLCHHRALAGWLYTSTHYAATKAMRTESRRRQREQAAPMMNEPETTAPTATTAEISAAIDYVLRDLDRAEREAVLLRFFESQSYSEIGARLGLSENAARMRVDRALAKLRERLGRRGIRSTESAIAAFIAAEAASALPAGFIAETAGGALASANAGGIAAALGWTLWAKIILAFGLSVGAAAYSMHEFRLTTARREALGELVRQNRVLAAQLTQFGGASAISENQQSPPLASNAAPLRLEDFTDRFGNWWDIPLGRSMATNTFGDLFRELRLDASQQAALEDILAKRRFARFTSNLQALAESQGVRLQDGVDVEILRAAVVKAWDESIRVKFGDAIMARVQQYDDTTRYRFQFVGIQRELNFTDSPLTSAQLNRLVDLMAGDPAVERWNRQTSRQYLDIPPAVVDGAAKFLNDTQLTALRRLQAARAAQEKLDGIAAEAAQQNKLKGPYPRAGSDIYQ